MKSLIVIAALLLSPIALSGDTKSPEVKTREVCTTVKDKKGRDAKECRTIRVHKKREGTPIPSNTNKK